MEILNLRKTLNGYEANGYFQLTGLESEVSEWISSGKEIMPNYAQAELDEIVKIKANDMRDKAMLAGVDYQASMVSLTDVDGNAMLQVKAAFEMGLTATTIHFKNGTKLPMAAADFPAFALWFVTERNRFFV